MIYIVQAAIGGPVKIGFTRGRSIGQRLGQLQAACPWPLLVVRTMPGSAGDEWALHRRFADQRLHGEWFALEGPLLEWLSAEHIEVRETVAPVAEALIGPLPSEHARVLAGLGSQWQRPGRVAAGVQLSVGRTTGLLRALRDKYGLVISRAIVVDGARTSEWRLLPGRISVASKPGLDPEPLETGVF